jgi:hypothetical protein
MNVVTMRLKSGADIEPLVLGLTPLYLDPSCHEALHEVDLGTLKAETESAEECGQSKG